MACAVGVVGSRGTAGSSSSWVGKGLMKGKKKNSSGIGVVKCVASPSYSSGLTDHFKILRVQPGASEIEVRKAFRQLALQYHPDVCKGNNCGVQFSRINEAYDIVMSSLRAPEEEEEITSTMQKWGDDDEMRGMYDSSWELWEEWMGFEGACTTDYSSHINPYI